MQILLSLSVALFAGLMLSRLAKKLKLPAVTAYLVAGILIGPYLLGALRLPGLGFISMADIKTYSLLSDIALGFIAFSIGNEFKISYFKRVGSTPIVIACLESFFAVVVSKAGLKA